MNLLDRKLEIFETRVVCEGNNCTGNMATVRVVNDKRYPYEVFECELEDKEHRLEADLVIKQPSGFALGAWF